MLEKFLDFFLLLRLKRKGYILLNPFKTAVTYIRKQSQLASMLAKFLVCVEWGNKNGI